MKRNYILFYVILMAVGLTFRSCSVEALTMYPDWAEYCV